jgi:hypothetical protein
MQCIVFSSLREIASKRGLDFYFCVCYIFHDIAYKLCFNAMTRRQNC